MQNRAYKNLADLEEEKEADLGTTENINVDDYI